MLQHLHVPRRRDIEIHGSFLTQTNGKCHGLMVGGMAIVLVSFEEQFIGPIKVAPEFWRSTDKLSDSPLL